MKLAFFYYLPVDSAGGVSKFYKETSLALSKRFKRFKTNIISFDSSSLYFILLLYSLYFFRNQRLKSRKKNSRGKNISGLNKKVSLFSLKRELNKYDLIYATNNFLDVFILKIIIGYNNIPPVIYGFHIPVYIPRKNSIHARFHNLLYASKFYRNAIAGAKKIHVLNSFDEIKMQKLYGKNFVQKIYNPFDFNAYEKLSQKNKSVYKLNRNRCNIMWTGRLTEQKGVKVLRSLIRSINETRWKEKIFWNIAGDGELKNIVNKLVVDWNNVHYFGEVANNLLPVIYKQVDLFISTSDWESFPYNILEAQALGIPVIAYDIQGCQDIIENGKNGYLVDNFTAFKDRIVFVLSKNNFSRRMIKTYIENKFDQEEIYKSLYRLFIKA